MTNVEFVTDKMQGHASQSLLAHGTPKAKQVTEEPIPLHNKSNVK